MYGQDERPWERQSGESEKAYEAFRLYRNLGGERSVSAVQRQLKKNRALLDRWKERWNWAERARAWDNDLERKAYEAAVREVQEMYRRHASMAVKLQARALEALAKTKPEKIRPKDLLAFIVEAAKLERASRVRLAEDAAPKDDDRNDDGGGFPFDGLGV